jgi:hypothetical protein
LTKKTNKTISVKDYIEDTPDGQIIHSGGGTVKIPAYMSDLNDDIGYVKGEDGKGLSTNDFTNQEKEKLAGLEIEMDEVQDTLKNKVVDYMGRITYDDMFLQYRGKEYNDGYNYVGIFSTGEWNLDEIGIFESYNVADLDMQRKTVFTSEGMKVYQREAYVSRAFGEWELVYESANSGGADMETIKKYVDEQIGEALEGDY